MPTHHSSRVCRSYERTSSHGSVKRSQSQLPKSVRSRNKRKYLEASSRASSLARSVVATSVVATRSPPDNAFAGDEESGEMELMDEVIMAIDMRNSETIGSAYYVTAEETLYVLSDVRYGGINLIDKLGRYTEPSVVLISSRVDETVEERLRANAGSDESPTNHRHFFLDIRPSHEFSYDSAIRKLTDLDLDLYSRAQCAFIVPGDDNPGANYRHSLEPGLSHMQGNTLQLASAIDLDSILSLGCAGSVLSYLERRQAILHLPGGANANSAFKVTYLETFSIEGIMSLSADAMNSLQILEADFHPHAHNHGPSNTNTGSKEGLSVFGLFQHLTRTPQGRYLLRQYFLRPSLDFGVLANRHEAIGILLHPDNELVLQNLVKNLKSISNMRNVMQSLKRGISNSSGKNTGMKSNVWCRIRSFAYYTLMIEQDMRTLTYANELEIRNKVIEGFDRRGLGEVGQAIIEVVDFGESQMAHRTIVLRGIDDRLDEMKRQYDGLEDMLNQVSREIGQTLPQDLATSLSVVFFPQIGFLIAMPVNPVTETVDYRDPDWQQSFYTTERVYFKDFRMVELDQTIGDIYADICDREIEIVYELAQRVLQYNDILIRASEICGELDCLAALAQGAKMYNLTRPTIVEDNVIDIKGGWHILQALVVPSCIANDLTLYGGPSSNAGAAVQTRDGSHQSLLVLTGPNYSGKSVFLKQNAIIVYLAHIGSFVPATEARIGITDQILTRITTRETVSTTQSAFLIDLRQISSAIYTMSERSLLVIDEFGKGTDSQDGAGLMAGLLRYLLDLGDHQPKVLAATHFHEIFEGVYIGEHEYLDFAHMEVRMDRKAVSVEDQVKYLYNLLPGRSTSSFGVVCAAMNGIEQDIITRAEDLLLHEARGVNLVELCAVSDEETHGELRQAEETARLLLMVDLEEDDTTGTHVEPEEWLPVLLAQISHGGSSYRLESGSESQTQMETRDIVTEDVSVSRSEYWSTQKD